LAVDERNKLNDLTAKEWIIGTKSVWLGKSKNIVDSNIRTIDLPETIFHEDYENFIKFFSKNTSNIVICSNNINNVITSIKSINNNNRNIVIINSNQKSLNKSKRLKDYPKLITNNFYQEISRIVDDTIDYILFSPTNHYLTNNFRIDMINDKITYEHAMSVNKKLLIHFYRILKCKKYITIFCSDFYIEGKLIPYHVDISELAQNVGFSLRGISILKHYCINQPINHTNILIFEKIEERLPKRIDNVETGLWFDGPKLSIPTWFNKEQSIWLSIPPPRDELKSQHPATFPESDIVKFINYTTKEYDFVLDPFMGVGSTLIACKMTNRNSMGIELTQKWIEITKKRLKKQKSSKKLHKYLDKSEDQGKSQTIIAKIIQGDSRKHLKNIKNNLIDLVITSPPYWGILNKKIDHKTKKERVKKGLDTKYSENQNDLANINSYEDFKKNLSIIFKECYRILKNKGYFIIIVSNFRHKSKFYLYHGEIIRNLRNSGFILIGIWALVQDNKNLYPYGYPFSFVSNIHHQNILVMKKVK
jgi:DNA modification methylase